MTIDTVAIENIRRIGGDALLNRMISVYINYSKEQMQEMIDHYTNQEIKEMGRSAHALKSSSANFGAQRLVDLCADIENRAQTLELDNIKDQISEAQLEMIRVINELENLLQVHS